LSLFTKIATYYEAYREYMYIVRTSNPYYNSYPTNIKYVSGKFTYMADKHR